jgi:transcriptional regulator with GAF, ATPase, and Fis domain
MGTPQRAIRECFRAPDRAGRPNPRLSARGLGESRPEDASAYYRLNVFPVLMPPLRARREDITALVRHCVDKYAKRMNRRIDTIPSHALEVFAKYSWPGNVRELQNFIERTVILSPARVLQPPLSELEQATLHARSSQPSTLKEFEREHVLRAIRESNWVIGGPNGAAPIPTLFFESFLNRRNKALLRFLVICRQ